MAFFWKFTRSGMYSRRYISLIVDATPDAMDYEAMVWRTSFEELGMFMILLQDVEVHNVPELGPTKPAFRDVVRSLGYEPSLNYETQRYNFKLVRGRCVMGRHGGPGEDWGFYGNKRTPISLSISDLQVASIVDANSGRRNSYDTEDKLSCFRNDPCFRSEGRYYDLMPKHVVMVPIVKRMLESDEARAVSFLCNFLKWRPWSVIDGGWHNQR